MSNLPYEWKYKTNLPTAPALLPEDQPAYLMELFEKAFQLGRKSAQADLREALGFNDAVLEVAEPIRDRSEE